MNRPKLDNWDDEVDSILLQLEEEGDGGNDYYDFDDIITEADLDDFSMEVEE